MATAATTSSAQAPALATKMTEWPERRVTGLDTTAPGMPGDAKPNSKPPSPSLDAALERLTDALRTASVSVQFEIDSTSHRVITKVMDKRSGEVIRQIPTEELVRISDAMMQLQGLFVRQTA